nr:P28 protein [Hibiscus chlorotic ringspot virus]
MLSYAFSIAFETASLGAALCVAPFAAAVEIVTHPRIAPRDPCIAEELCMRDELEVADPTDEEPEACLENLPNASGDKKMHKIKRRHRGKFALHAAIAAKLHFGGTPTPTRSNELAVRRWLASYCKERRLVDTHALQAIALATPLVLTPGAAEITERAILNSAVFGMRRAALAEASKPTSLGYQMVFEPHRPRTWLRAWRKVVGLPDFQGYSPVK